MNIKTRVYSFYSKGKVHTKILTEDLVPLLEKKCVGEGKVFNVTRANQQMMNEYLHRGCKALGLQEKYVKGFTVHKLRHSRASNMLAQGIPMKIVQEALGHESILTTMDFYAHLDQNHVRNALNLNPQVQKALTIQQRMANIRSIMETAGLTKLLGTEVRIKEENNVMSVEFNLQPV